MGEAKRDVGGCSDLFSITSSLMARVSWLLGGEGTGGKNTSRLLHGRGMWEMEGERKGGFGSSAGLVPEHLQQDPAVIRSLQARRAGTGLPGGCAIPSRCGFCGEGASQPAPHSCSEGLAGSEVP